MKKTQRKRSPPKRPRYDPVRSDENTETIREEIGRVCPETSESPPSRSTGPESLPCHLRKRWLVLYVPGMLRPSDAPPASLGIQKQVREQIERRV